MKQLILFLLFSGMMYAQDHHYQEAVWSGTDLKIDDSTTGTWYHVPEGEFRNQLTEAIPFSVEIRRRDARTYLFNAWTPGQDLGRIVWNWSNSKNGTVNYYREIQSAGTNYFTPWHDHTNAIRHHQFILHSATTTNTIQVRKYVDHRNY